MEILSKHFFKIKSSELIAKSVEDKNWKMSQLVDQALASENVKVLFKI